MPTPSRTLIGSATVALALTACLSGDSTGPVTSDRAISADFALLAADGVGEDVELMGGPAGALGMGLFGVALPGPGGPLAARDFGCRDLDRPNLAVTRTCTFTDAGGAAQSSYDPLTTASIRIETSVDGERSHDRWTASITRSSDLTVSGLAGTETQRTWNGSEEESVSRSQHNDAGQARGYTMEGQVTITGVVMPVPGGPGKWPLAGTIVRTVSGEITDGPRAGETFSRTATTTFDGTQFATMTIGDETFTVDLMARRAARRR